jgi:hypothetical protein
MFKKKKHPFTYINETNYDIIKEIISTGMNQGKIPKEIATVLAERTKLPYDVAEAIVSNEVRGLLDG